MFVEPRSSGGQQYASSDSESKSAEIPLVSFTSTPEEEVGKNGNKNTRVPVDWQSEDSTNITLTGM